MPAAQAQGNGVGEGNVRMGRRDLGVIGQALDLRHAVTQLQAGPRRDIFQHQVAVLLVDLEVLSRIADDHVPFMIGDGQSGVRGNLQAEQDAQALVGERLRITGGDLQDTVDQVALHFGPPAQFVQAALVGIVNAQDRGQVHLAIRGPADGNLAGGILDDRPGSRPETGAPSRGIR